MIVVLLSGGLDSAVCLALYSRRDDVHALFVDYGQPHMVAELSRAFALARRYGVKLHRARVELPTWEPDGIDRTMLVPGRNLVLIALAATLGERVVIGCNADDRDVYRDCREEYLAGIGAVEVVAPLVTHRKPAIGRLAQVYRIAPEETWSCYYPVGRGDGIAPCGACDACMGRAEAIG